jgi:hypothetical protein
MPPQNNPQGIATTRGSHTKKPQGTAGNALQAFVRVSKHLTNLLPAQPAVAASSAAVRTCSLLAC